MSSTGDAQLRRSKAVEKQEETSLGEDSRFPVGQLADVSQCNDIWF